jgi:predicted metal-binding membrane protein
VSSPGPASARISRETSPTRVDPPAQLPLRQSLIVWGGILTFTAIAWFVLARMPMPVSGMNGGAISCIASTIHAGAVPWTLRDTWLIFAMWTVMMAAMMLPSASPMIEMYARIARGRSAERSGRAWLFAAGYLIAWTGFSAAITVSQYGLERTRIVADSMRMAPFAGGLLLVAAGIYQFTPLKQACLMQCRSPLGYFMTEWRSGRRGAFVMGLNHGVFCIGCCWMLMALMFGAGVMNLAWAAALTMLVLLEKATPWGGAVARACGAAMVASGIALVAFG